MERCLRIQQEIMTALGTSSVALATARPARLPFIEKILRVDEGRELVAFRRIDPAADLFLADHALGRRIAVADPELSGLLLMPLTVSIEMLAEAANALYPSLTAI